MNRFLNIRVTLKNVCYNKEISIGVILCDDCGKIIEFKTFTTILHKHCNSYDDNSCCNHSCGTLKRKVSFILPKTDACRRLKFQTCLYYGENRSICNKE